MYKKIFISYAKCFAAREACAEQSSYVCMCLWYAEHAAADGCFLTFAITDVWRKIHQLRQEAAAEKKVRLLNGIMVMKRCAINSVTSSIYYYTRPNKRNKKQILNAWNRNKNKKNLTIENWKRSAHFFSSYCNIYFFYLAINLIEILICVFSGPE